MDTKCFNYLQILFWQVKPPFLPHLHGVDEQSSLGKAVSGHISFEKRFIIVNRINYLFFYYTTCSQSAVPISIIIASYIKKELVFISYKIKSIFLTSIYYLYTITHQFDHIGKAKKNKRSYIFQL
jgi:hypothetical protein